MAAVVVDGSRYEELEIKVNIWDFCRDDKGWLWVASVSSSERLPTKLIKTLFADLFYF